MLVTPGLSQEIEQVLPKAQEQLAQAAGQLETAKRLLPTGKELTELRLSVGDISLLVRKEKGILRRFY